MKLHEVMLKKANELGLYDMSGNVWEWVWDYYVHIQENTPPIVSRCPQFGIIQRTLKGGCWLLHENFSNPSRRMGCPPDTHWQVEGFRVVRSK